MLDVIIVDDEAAGRRTLREYCEAERDLRVVGEFGKVMVQEGRCQDGLAFLKRAIELQPNDWTLYSALGIDWRKEITNTPSKRAYRYVDVLGATEFVPDDEIADLFV